MKQFLMTKKGMLCAVAAVAVLLAAIAAASYGIWLGQQPKFHDLTVELGTDAVSLRDFMTEYAKGSKVGFVSDPALVDLNRVGQTQLTLRHGNQEQTVTLTVQDTAAPTAQIPTSCAIPVDRIPQAAELVSNVVDMSQVTVYYRTEPQIPLDYSDIPVEIVVEDACGNRFSQECVLVCQWLPETFALEYGEMLTKDMLLTNDLRDASLLDQAQLDVINASDVGTYTVTGTVGDNTRTCTVTVQDTLGPELELNEVRRYPGEAAELDDFVASVTDRSGVADVRLVSQFDVNVEGKYEVTVEAEDICGNVTTQTTVLWVATDMDSPYLYGDFSVMTVEKNSQPDFLTGFQAYDDQSGDCEVICDTGNLDLTTAGTYFVTYRAVDASGNKTELKRTVVVQHDGSDTQALVEEFAAQFSDDPEEMRLYVQSQIHYNASWGGEDPVWYGLTTMTGNCYVHALVLQALLTEKGYETQLIWTTDYTHYWLLINLEGVWRHIDGTPGYWHRIYSIMTDEQRMETLNGRAWDTSLWPACE